MPKQSSKAAELLVDLLVIGGVVSLDVGMFLLATWAGFVVAGLTSIAAGGLLYWWPRRQRGGA